MHEIDSIINENAYEQYLIKSAIEDVKLNGFAELLIAEGNGAGPYKLQSIREDVGDKIKNLYDRLVNTITRLYSKFIDFISSKINADAEYFEKNKEIIFNKKAPNVPIANLGDHETGLQRYTNVKVPTFQSVADELNDDGTVLRKKLVTIYKDANQNFKEVATNFFSGNDNRSTKNLDQLNITNIYNFLVDFQTKVKPILDQDKKTIEANKSVINQILSTAKQAAKNNENNAAASNTATNASAPNTASSGQGAAPAANASAQPKKESTSLLYDYFPNAGEILTEAAYFLEADPGSSQATIGKPQTPPSGATTQQKSAATARTQDLNKATDQNNPGRLANSGSNLQQPPAGQTPNQQAGVNANNSSTEIEAKEKAFATYCTIANEIIACKMQGLVIIRNDYRNILRYIISANIGNNQAPENTAPIQQPTNYNQQQAPAAQPAQQPAQQAPAAQA